MTSPYIKNCPYHRRNIQNKKWKKYTILEHYRSSIRLKDIFNDKL